MKSRNLRLLIVAGVVALLTSACIVDPQQAGQAAERVMTAAAQITPEAMETAIASAPLSAGPEEAPTVYARCITRSKTALLQLPQEGATEAAALGSRSIITAYGRTTDAAWVLGWDAGEVRGWLPAKIIGCTVPVEDLRATDAGILLTPTAIVVAAATPAATAEETSTAAVEVTAEMAATPDIATEAPLPTETALPTDLPTPTASPTRATLPTPTALAATAAPTPASRVATVIVVVTATPAQVRDLRCTVTPGAPVNLRKGPARTATLIDTLIAGTRFLAQGRNEDASWIYGFTERQMPGWLIASSIACDGDPAQLVEVDR